MKSLYLFVFLFVAVVADAEEFQVINEGAKVYSTEFSINDGSRQSDDGSLYYQANVVNSQLEITVGNSNGNTIKGQSAFAIYTSSRLNSSSRVAISSNLNGKRSGSVKMDLSAGSFYVLFVAELDSGDTVKFYFNKAIIVEALPPVATYFTPERVTLDETVDISVYGEHFPDTLAANIHGSDSCNQRSHRSNKVVFRCFPRVEGQQRFYVKDRAGGNIVSGTDNWTISVEPGSSEPVAYSFSPSSSTIGESFLLYVYGENFPSSIVANIQGSDSCVQSEFSSTQVVFQCLPLVAGSQRLYLKNRSNGDFISGSESWRIDITEAAEPPVVYEYSPASSEVGQWFTLSVKGANLPNTIVANIHGSDSCTLSSYSSAEVEFLCYPTVEGYQRLYVKDKSQGSVIAGSEDWYIDVKNTPVGPQADSYSPSVVDLNQGFQLTITGSALPNTIVANIHGSDSCSLEQYSATEVVFGCNPTVAGNQRLYVKDQSGGSFIPGSENWLIDVQTDIWTEPGANEIAVSLASYYSELNSVLSTQEIDSALARAESVAILDSFLILTVPEFGIDTSELFNTYADIAENEWFLTSLLRLAYYRGANDNFVLNKENRLFRPFDHVTRQEFVAMVVEGLNLPVSEGTSYIESFSDFHDDEVWADWAKPYFNTAVKYGLIQGNNNFLYPSHALTIKESLLILGRVEGALQGQYLHGVSGFSSIDDIDFTRIVNATIGEAYTPEYYLPRLSKIDIVDVDISAMSDNESVSNCGVTNALSLTVSSEVDDDERVFEYYWWQSDRGYFRQFGSISSFKTVCFIPGENSTRDYSVIVNGGDNIGFVDSHVVNIDYSQFKFQDDDVSDLKFDKLSIENYDAIMRPSTNFDIQLATDSVEKSGVNYQFSRATVTMPDASGNELLLFSGHAQGGKLQFDGPRLSALYGETVDLTVTAVAGGTEQRTSFQVQYLPQFIVQGELKSTGSEFSITHVLMNGQRVNVDDAGRFIHHFEFSASSNEIVIDVPESTLSNQFSSDVVTVSIERPIASVVLIGEDIDFDRDGVENALDADDDNDGMPDSYEEAYGFSVLDASDALLDLDGDGLSNLEEFNLGTDPSLADSDGDGQDDNVDSEPSEMDPLDFDGDGMPNEFEAAFGFNPYNALDAGYDADADGLSNVAEYIANTDPTVKDSDGNGIDDGDELANLPVYPGAGEWVFTTTHNGIKRYGRGIRTDIPQRAHILDGKLQLLFGNASDRGVSVTNTLLTVELESGEVTVGQPMGRNRLHGNATVAYGGKLYSLGGMEHMFNYALNNNVVYDPVINEWRNLPGAPLSRANALAAAYDNKIYMFGGWGFDTFNEVEIHVDSDNFFYSAAEETETWRREIQVFDINENTWVLDGELPDMGEFTSSAQINSNVYFVAEPDWVTPNDHIVVYNLQSKEWNNLTLPQSLIRKKIVTVGNLLVIYGLEAFARYSNSGWYTLIYDTDANVWYRGVPLPKPDETVPIFELVSDNERLYYVEYSDIDTGDGPKSIFELTFADVSLNDPVEYTPWPDKAIASESVDSDIELQLSDSGQVLSLVVSDESVINAVRNGTSNTNSTALKQLTQAVYSVLDDDVEFLVFIANEDQDQTTKVPNSYHRPVKNNVEGIGLGQFDFTSDYGSSGKLESIVMLNNKNDVIFGPILHEMAHRWGNYLAEPLDSLRQAQWLGWDEEQAYHWGYLSSGGQLGGWDDARVDSIDDNENTYFLNDAQAGLAGFSGIGPGDNSKPYSQLELYLMGLVEAEDVPDLTQPSAQPNETALYPLYEIDGFETISMSDVIATNGERKPSVAESKTSINVAFIVLTHEALSDSEWVNFEHQVSNFVRAESDDYQRLYNYWEATQGKQSLVIPDLKKYFTLFKPDMDSDGVPDESDAFIDNYAASIDSDDDGLPDSFNPQCDAQCQQESGLVLDEDNDNDGVPDYQDVFPFDDTESSDLDGDGIGDNADTDIDGDGYENWEDDFPANNAIAVDTDGDGLADDFVAGCDSSCQGRKIIDDDDDNDGIPDIDDEFPLDPSNAISRPAFVGELIKPLGSETATPVVFSFDENSAIYSVSPITSSGTITFSGEYRKVWLYELPDMNANGAFEYGLLGIRNDTRGPERLQMQILDSQSGERISTLNWVDKWSQVSAVILDDVTGDGAADIGLQGYFEQGYRPQLVVRDGITNRAHQTYSFPDLWNNPLYMGFSDVTGDGIKEVALFGEVKRTGKLQVKVIDGTNKGNKLKAYNFPAKWTDTSWHNVGDYNGDGEDDWGLFGQSLTDGRWQLIIKDGTTPKGALAIYSWPDMSHTQLLFLTDANEDGVKELAVGGLNTKGRWQLQIKDGQDRNNTIKNISWADNRTETSLHVIGDVDGDGKDEVALLGKSSRYELVIKLSANDYSDETVLDLSNDWQSKPAISQYDSDGDGIPEWVIWGLDSSSNVKSSVISLP